MATIHVPKFGNFDEDEDVPYTQFFDTARIDKVGGKLFNPNDPYENPGAFPGLSSPINPHLAGRKSHPEAKMAVQRKTTEYGSGATVRRHPTAVHIRNEAASRKLVDKQKEDGKTTCVSANLRNHEKPGDNGERTWERNISSDGGLGLSPTKPKKKNVRQKSGSSERSTVSKGGGEWDESDPSSSADGYTHVFEKVREEHSSATTNVSAKSDSRLPALGRNKANRDLSPKVIPCYCCFAARN